MKFLSGLFFNMLMAILFATVLGINPLLAFGGLSAGAALMPKLPGVAAMAVQKEIWMTSIVENLFADNMFMSKAFNADEFVNNKTVHIPNAGSPSAVVKNRSSFPASVTARTDTDLTFDLDEYTTNPIKIPHADTVELSYNKRESVLKNDKAQLIESVADEFTYKWSPTGDAIIRTSGAAVAAHTPSATGDRKALDKADFKKAMTKFNQQNIPQEGRWALVDADMLDQLLDSLTDKQLDNFNQAADIANGKVGKLYTFNVMMRSKAARYTTGLTAKAWTTSGAAGDNAAALLWYEGSVCRALGQTEMFDDEGSPTYYADIYSFLVRAGGRPMRSGVEGLVAIVQDTTV
jgi:hypothetical protein